MAPRSRTTPSIFVPFSESGKRAFTSLSFTGGIKHPPSDDCAHGSLARFARTRSRNSSQLGGDTPGPGGGGGGGGGGGAVGVSPPSNLMLIVSCIDPTCIVKVPSSVSTLRTIRYFIVAQSMQS